MRSKRFSTSLQVPHRALLDWAQHGINGRGVLLDLVKYYTQSGAALPYDPWTSHGFTVQDLEACAKHQGVQFRRGDILLIRAGFMQRYYASGQEEKDGLATSEETLLVATFTLLVCDEKR